MRIGLNLLHLHEGIGGVWNYVENLMNALGKYEKTHTYVVFVTCHSRCLVPETNNFIAVVIPISPLNVGVRIVFENTLLHCLGKKYRIDCLHWFANVVSPVCLVPCLVTVHDLLPLKHPGTYSLLKRLYLRLMFRITAKKARSILAISRTTAKDVQRFLAPVTNRIHVVPVILDPRFDLTSGHRAGGFKKKHLLPAHFWLYVANFYPHKNHVRLLYAYAGLKQKGLHPWPLVLRGDAGPDTGSMLVNIQNEIEKLGLSKDVIWLGRLDYGELPALYASASALVFASLFEGGGIPVIEAMACGCPVAASDIPAVKESAGDAALFFDGKSSTAIENAMADLQHNTVLQQELKARGIVRASRFSGERTIKKLVAAYVQAAGQ
jgi:glycosyltransferase involved in cell wall biosynthesis